MRVRKIRRKPAGAKSISGRLVSKPGATAAKKAVVTKKKAMGGAKYGAGGVSKLGAKKKRRRVSLTGGSSASSMPVKKPGATSKYGDFPRPMSRRKRRFGRGG